VKEDQVRELLMKSVGTDGMHPQVLRNLAILPYP